MNAIDTNVLVYAVDAAEPVKQPIAVRLLDDLTDAPEPTVLLWQVVSEFLSCLRRWENLGKVDSDQVDQYFDQFGSAYPLVTPDRAVLDRAIDLHRRHSLSHWDSMLLAGCVEAGVSTLYSEDLQHGADYDTVTVVDPFA